MSNIIIGCDQKYFDDWGIVLLQSINYHAPWVNLHCHIVNPTKDNHIPYVDITTEQTEFTNDVARISHLQSVRFLIAYEKFNKTDKVISLDCDTICTKSFSQKNLEEVFEQQYVLQHKKDYHWLAGFVTLANYDFRKELYNRLTATSLNEREWGRDQNVLESLSTEFKFEPLPIQWMSIGKNKSNSVFLTLKGNQKETDKYLKRYRIYQNFMKWGL